MLSEDMAPSSLKKMSGVRRMKEGNYASLETSPRVTSVNSDLGLTLLPGLQIQRKDEKRLRTAAESSPRTAGSEHVERSKQWTPLEIGTRAKYLHHEMACTHEVKNPSSSPNLDSTKASHLTASMNREWPFFQILTEKNGNGVVQDNASSTAVAPKNEHQIGTVEIRNAKSRQRGDYSSRVMNWRKLRSSASNGLRDPKVSEVKEAPYETHYNGFRVPYDQGLSGNNAVHPGKRLRSSVINGVAFGGTGGGSGSSKPESRRQITRSPEIASARAHQGTISGSEDTTTHSESPATAAFASGSPTKHQDSKPKKLLVHCQSRNLSKVSTQSSKHSGLLPDSPANTGVQVLRPRKGVNRSWTSHFPAKAKLPHRANLLAPHLLAAPFTPTEDHQHPHFISAPLTSTNFHTYTNFSSTSSSTSLPQDSDLSAAFGYYLDVGAPKDTLITALAGNQRQSARRRSSSMPNLSSTSAPMNMAYSNNFGPTSMPTPPREKPSSLAYSRPLSQYDNAAIRQSHVGPPRDHVNKSFNANISSSQGAKATEGLQHNRLPLEIKPNYSHEEVKSLMSHFAKQAQNLKAEITNLRSSNIAMKKDMDSLLSGKADMTKQIQCYERIITQKDQQMETMQQSGGLLQQQYKQVWDKYHRLIATTRKEDGTGNPSAIVQTIRRSYISDTIAAANQGTQPNATTSPVNSANRAQLSDSRHRFGHMPSCLQGHVRPLPVPGSSEADEMDASSRSLHQQANAGANINGTNPLQGVSISAYQRADSSNVSGRPSVRPRLAVANQNNASSPHDPSTRWMQSNQSLNATVSTVTANVPINDRHTGHVLTQRLTIDLTDEAQPPSCSASSDIPVLQKPQLAVQGGNSPVNFLAAHYSLAQHQVGSYVPSQYPSAPSAQNQSSQTQLPSSQDTQSSDREAMRIQREAFARMADKPLSWLQGENPFRKGAMTDERIGRSNSGPSAQSNAEKAVILTEFPEAGNVAPLPETAIDRQPKKKASKKTKAVLTAEAKKERAKVYRKTAADKKRREQEAKKQLLQSENMSNNAMRAQKQERRANKVEKRQEQARNSSGEVGPWEPKTLNGRIYPVTGVQHAVRRGSIKEAPSNDHDSLFGDDEDDQMEIEGFESSSETDSSMHDDEAAVEDGVDSAYVAELEALLSADEDVGTRAGTLGGEDTYRDFLSESEESEEE